MKFTMLSTVKVAANLHLYGGKTYDSSDLPRGVKVEDLIKNGQAVKGSTAPVNVAPGDVTDLPPQTPPSDDEEESGEDESTDEDESGEETSDEDESSDDEEEKDEEEETPKRPKRRRRR